MPRPCHTTHVLSPRTCRVCAWCIDPTARGASFRRFWGEPEPNGTSPALVAEIVPGLHDPMPDPAAVRPPGWAYDPAVIARHRDAFWSLVRAHLPPPGPRRGAGVIIPGGGKFWPGVVVAVRMLRETGCRLPIQIWHRGDAEPVRPSDLDGVTGVEIRDATKLRPAPRILAGWDIKTTAILASGWERVFFQDADAYCVRDPEPLLDQLSRDAPLLYWQEFENKAVRWSVWGLSGTSIPPVQGGQLALDVRHGWRTLVLAHWINQHSDFTYSHQYGDQDAWRVVLTATGEPATSLGVSRWNDVAFICDLDDKPLIVHRCQAKMFYPEDVAPGDRQSNRRRNRLPAEERAWAHFERVRAARSAAEVFGQVYARGLWGPPGLSGAGSTEEQAGPYLQFINGLIRLAGWRRLVDLGSGDGAIAAKIEAPEVVAVECHAPHVERLRREAPRVEWHCLDLDRDREQLPSGDVALLKDVLHHWPGSLVRDWLTWARGCGKWRWLICTQDCHQMADGQDCPLGGYRPLSPALWPLRDLGLVRMTEYLHKGVLLLPIA